MTDAEEKEVRAELREFKEEWHAAQERRAKDFWTSFRWVVGLIASLMISFTLWAWYVTAGATDGKEAAIKADAIARISDANAQSLVLMRRTIDARADHGTRLSVLEDRYDRIQGSLDVILNELRQERRAAGGR